MNLKGLSYLTAVCLLFGVACLVQTLEYAKAPTNLQNSFILIKVGFGMFNVGLAIYFHRVRQNDFGSGIFFANLVIYCWIFMWYSPLYEIAYLEVALGASFVRMKKTWIFPLIFGIGLVGIFITYLLQDLVGWSIPTAVRSDWVWTVVIFFLLAWAIQKFAIDSYRQEQDRLTRLSVIGKETTRLTHDIKGLLSSPLAILESLRANGEIFIPAKQSQNLKELAKDMDHVREVIQSIHRLVLLEENPVSINILDVLDGPLKIFERRLSGIQVILPEPRLIFGTPDRLHSVFFNLILNSIEAFERRSSQNLEGHLGDPACIDIYWKKNELIFSDNAGGFNLGSRKGLGSGLGLELVKGDMEKMGARFKMKTREKKTKIHLTFPLGK